MFGYSKKAKNRIGLISIHIPKTAGTSFRNILKDAYGAENVVRLDILKGASKVLIDNIEFKSRKLSSRIKVVHGHFNYIDLSEKFDLKDETPIITWLRNPIERVVSNYYYLSKRLKEELDEEGKGLNILAKMQKSLIEYARLEMNQNRMSKFLNGISLEEMKFVGIQEHFNEDLEYFGKLFGIENIKPLEHNITGKKHNVNDEIIREIAELNSLDMDIYKMGLELRNKRIKI